jgi:hypothetical protein
MKKFGLVGALLAIVVLASGCMRGPFDPSAPVGSVPVKTVEVVQYRGQDLFCIEQRVAHDGHAYTCDFAAFYAEPPKHGSPLEVAHVSLVTMPYRGGTLYCFESDTGHDTEMYNCDFQRFYVEHPAALQT